MASSDVVETKAVSREPLDSEGQDARTWTYTASGDQFNISGGTIHIGNQYVSNGHRSAFDLLDLEAHPLNATGNKLTKRILATRIQFQSSKRPRKLLEYSNNYEPYPTVDDREIVTRLLQIARHFQFLDRGFAEYFQAVVSKFEKEDVQGLLNNARKSISEIQNRNAHRQSDVYIGDLGHFCEAVSDIRNEPGGANIPFRATYWRDQEILYYLQDAFEVPYWDFMLDLLLAWRDTSRGLIGDVVFRVLDSVRFDVADELRELGKLKKDDEENIKPILNGIGARMKLLDSVSSKKMSNLKDEASVVVKPPPPIADGEHTSRSKETVILISLILFFLICAIIPGYIGFTLSMKSDTPGTTHDADYWYLIQSSIMAVLGNLIMVVPLLKRSWFSRAYILMWTFFILGLALAAISIIIYPRFNAGWSSVSTFLGSIASAASVLVITQATAKEVNRGKVKTD